MANWHCTSICNELFNKEINTFCVEGEKKANMGEYFSKWLKIGIQMFYVFSFVFAFISLIRKISKWKSGSTLWQRHSRVIMGEKTQKTLRSPCLISVKTLALQIFIVSSCVWPRDMGKIITNIQCRYGMSSKSLLSQPMWLTRLGYF